MKPQLVRAIREHDPDAEMPMIEVADFAPHRLERCREIEHFGQCGHKDDFGSLLHFTVQMLFYVDYQHDGKMIDRVAENAICESVDLETFENYVGRIANRLKPPIPEFLSTPRTYSVAVRIYNGWIDIPRICYDFRSTLVWQTGDRMIGLHTRQSV